ncbi:MAG TPA: relaxase/mobilization nuclease RlxS [Rhizomicrobium sp.]
MTTDDEFEPKLGRIRSRPKPKLGRALDRIVRDVARSGGRLAKKSARFDGSRIGRGAGVGRVLRQRDRYAGHRTRRVVIQTRIVKLKGKSMAAARLHLRYIQRDGVTREGQPGQLYDAREDHADDRAFAERVKDDRHQFRFIVSAEDGAEYADLKLYVRRLMSQMEQDLGTRLDWVAADHFNTGHPHTHVVLRGVDETGRDLVIAREYLSYGMRERACEIATRDLGPRSDLDIQNRLRLEIDQERFTSLDRDLLRDADPDGNVRAIDRDAFRQSLRAGRLQKLGRLGLAEEVATGRWQLAEDLKTTLQRMGERGDIIKAMHHALRQEASPHHVSDYAIYEPDDKRSAWLVGKVVTRGLGDELHDKHFLIVDGTDGRSHYVAIGSADHGEPTAEGSIVAITPYRPQSRSVDRTIAEIAATNGGHYSASLHLQTDIRASEEFIASHIRRLEALRRSGNIAERDAAGVWTIVPDHLEQIASLEKRQARAAPVIIERLSKWPVARQIEADGATWLDSELTSAAPIPLREAGFGREVSDALAQRRQWLIARELARVDGDNIVYRAGLLKELTRREIVRVGAQLSSELGVPFAETRQGDRVEGIYRRKVELISGSFALIQKSREFTLVPWRPVLERAIGQEVTGIPRGQTISWTFGRTRGPSIG